VKANVTCRGVSIILNASNVINPKRKLIKAITSGKTKIKTILIL
jgi:hypothetical protein